MQAKAQLSSEWTLMDSDSSGTPDMRVWLAENVPEGSAVGIDALCHTIDSAKTLQTQLVARGVKLTCVEGNLVDKCALLTSQLRCCARTLMCE